VKRSDDAVYDRDKTCMNLLLVVSIFVFAARSGRALDRGVVTSGAKRSPGILRGTNQELEVIITLPG